LRTHFDCFPCFLKQASRTGKILGLDDNAVWDLMKRAGIILSEMKEAHSPPRNAVAIYDMISERAGTGDPFREIKRQSTLHALSLYDELKKKVLAHPDPLEAAVKYAACGNVIDYGVSSSFDIMAEIQNVLDNEFHVWDHGTFLSRLQDASMVLYLGDNCGETVFDRLLIETMGKPVTYVVRDGPIINDVTMDDALEAGLDKVATLMSSGCRAPGVVLEQASGEFRHVFETAPLVISKGQGNFETLCDEPKEIFFLFKIKCRVVAEYLHAPMGSLYWGPARPGSSGY